MWPSYSLYHHPTSILLLLLMMMMMTSVNGKLRHKGHGEKPVHVRRPHRQTELRITTVKVEPYVMLKTNRMNATWHDADIYEGYIVDLIKELSSMVGFTYSLDVTEDGNYGNKKPEGWDGVIGDLLNYKADLAAAPLFITKPREKVVDFSRGFMNIHATALMRKPAEGSTLSIRTVADLINQSEIRYGTLDRGIIRRAFETTNDTVSSILWRKMERRSANSLTKTNQEGIDRVRQERYAFILPSNIGEYVAQMQPCDLITVGKFLMDKSFALALRKGSRLLNDLNRALTILDASGQLDVLYHRWWVDRNTCKPAAAGRVYKSVNDVTGDSPPTQHTPWRIATILSTISLTMGVYVISAA